MIACLRGELLFKSPERLLIDVNGVGYDLSFCQAGASLLPEVGEDVFIHTYLNVREDALDLYGFMRVEEKEMFVTLLNVSGIGPKVGLNILSAIQPVDLARSLLSEDIHRLTKLPGIGKKTAERLCLELKDRVQEFAGQESWAEHQQENDEDVFSEDIISALINLGYPRAQARQALQTVKHKLPEGEPVPPLEEMLRYALRALA